MLRICWWVHPFTKKKQHESTKVNKNTNENFKRMVKLLNVATNQPHPSLDDPTYSSMDNIQLNHKSYP